VQIPEARYAKSGDVSIAYQVVGDGPFDVVFSAGISHVELLWEMRTVQTRIAERLASFARLIVFDKRGVGMSDRVAGVPPLETRMDDLRAVMDAAGSPRAALFGLEDAAVMGLLFAATYPERVSALVLLNASARGMWAPDYPWGLTDEQVWGLKENVRRTYFGPRDASLERLRQRLGNMGDEELALLRNYLRRAAGSPGALDTLTTMLHDADVRQVLPAIRVPTLLVHGTENVVIPIERARYAAEHIPGARLLELPGEGFVPVGAALDRTLDETERFLTGVWESGGWEEPEPDRVLATVLFTDIVGSSERAVELGDRAWRELLVRHHGAVRQQLVRFRGREVDTAGDGFLASFDGPARAIRGTRRFAYGGVRADRRQGRRDRGPHRRQSGITSRAGRGARLEHRQGSRRRLRARFQGSRRA
jgi:pimeloyl-ACP methyl ester carboxylesterase